MKKRLVTFICCLYCCLASTARIYNVCDYGAKGDGKTLDSPAINAAIEAAVKDGGHTYFHNSLIWAEGQVNVSITGHGMIDGKGKM